MKKFGILAVLAVMAITTSASWALAQQERRSVRRSRMGFGPPSSVRLATAKEVVADLKLSEEQQQKIAEINSNLESEVRKAFGSGEAREKLQELMQNASANLAEVLDDDQEKRLTGILIQINGASAMMDSSVAKALDITDDQERKLRDVMRNSRDRFREVFELPPEERRVAMDEVRSEIDEDLMDVLTEEQKAQMESLKGEPIEIDMAQFRFGGGREDRGDRRGRPGRGERDRDRDQPPEFEKSSS